MHLWYPSTPPVFIIRFEHSFVKLTQVPPAIKSLYADPLPDASHIPSVNDSILTPGESVERWRMEEEMNRELFTAPRQPSLTHNQDEVCIVP